MLGSPISVAKTTEAPVIMNESPVQASVTLPQAQAFTLPTTNASIPPQAVMQTHVPTKNMGVKVLLFVVMFAGL